MALGLHSISPMKIGARWAMGAIAWIAVAGCARTETPAAPPPPPQTPPTAGGEIQETALKGFAAFGSQCVSGFNTDPKAVKLELWACPLNLPVVELAEPIQPLFFNADCKHKLLTIRSQDKTIDQTWELMPDGSFNFTQDGVNAKLKEDGSGNSNCVTSLSMDLWGQVDCSTPTSDQAKIRFEMRIWLNKGAPPARSSASPQCKVPAKCYFHAITAVSQCT